MLEGKEDNSFVMIKGNEGNRAHRAVETRDGLAVPLHVALAPFTCRPEVGGMARRVRPAARATRLARVGVEELEVRALLSLRASC